MKVINRTFFRLRMLVLIEITTGMQQATSNRSQTWT
jgi:hypothetical protein